jgi:hypothetical protein
VAMGELADEVVGGSLGIGLQNRGVVMRLGHEI